MSTRCPPIINATEIFKPQVNDEFSISKTSLYSSLLDKNQWRFCEFQFSHNIALYITFFTMWTILFIKQIWKKNNKKDDIVTVKSKWNINRKPCNRYNFIVLLRGSSIFYTITYCCNFLHVSAHSSYPKPN